jgi:hypothetical protein
MSLDDRNRDAVEEDRRLQADPDLGLSGGRAKTSQIVWVGLAAIAIIVLVIFGMSQRGGQEQAAVTPPTQQNAPPARAGSQPQGANPTPAQTQAQTGSQDSNTGARSGTTQRSSEVDAVSGDSNRNSGSGKVAPPR